MGRNNLRQGAIPPVALVAGKTKTQQTNLPQGITQNDMDKKEFGMRLDITLTAEMICKFDNFQQWVNNASSWIGGFPGWEEIVCVSSDGKVCTGGEDMIHARDNNLFPVKAYRLIRASE